MFMRSPAMGTEIDPSEDIEYTKGMPDKAQFGGYYRSVVPFGSEMTKTQVKQGLVQLAATFEYFVI